MTSHTEHFESMLTTAIEAARMAGHHALDMMETTQTSIKNGSEMVTEADRQCQALVIQHIESEYPDHGFVGEEGDQGRLFKRPPSDTDGIWWVIDPIDGTNNYAHGIPQFSVSIGAMQLGRPVVGAIYDPCTDHMYTATAQSTSQDNGAPMTVSHESLNLYSSVGIDCHFGDTIPPWVHKIMTSTRFRNLGTTALHLSYVANGGFAGMALFTPKLWDLVAGCLIAEKAGAIISDYQGNPLWPLDPSTYQGTAIPSIMGNPVAHKELLAMINKA